VGELDLAALGSFGAIHTIASGQSWVPGDGVHGHGVVLHGALELRASPTLSLGVVGRGECFDLVSDGPRPYTLRACEPTTIIVLSPLAFELLAPAAQRALDRLAAAGATRRFDRVVAAQRASADRAAQLATWARGVVAQPSAILGSPPLRQALAEIPALPMNAIELTSKLLDERTHAADVVASIKNDPALAALVLKCVNPAHYGLAVKVSDYHHAFLLLGTHAVSQLVLESAVTRIMPDGPAARDIQTRAHLVSVLAYEIALRAPAVTPAVASTIGLLHNIGDSVALLIRGSRPELAALIDCVDSPSLGADVLAGWGVPARVHETVARQRVPEILWPHELEAHVDEVGVLYLARACHDVLLDGAPAPPNLGAYMARLGLPETTWESFCRDTIGPALAKRAERLPAAARARAQRVAAGTITTP
jgi:HD-like signal output (HDOD) protein